MHKNGVSVTVILADNQFECTQDGLASYGIQLNIASASENVPDIERCIWTVKERVRSIYNVLPFKKMPLRILTEMVYTAVYWLNMFPVVDGILKTLSPRAIVTGLLSDFNLHFKLEFGSYEQTHEDHNNSMAPRTKGATLLRPTGNSQGGYYF